MITRIVLAGLAMLLILQQAILAANPISYQAALKDAQAQQRPLLVLVGATWCPGCQTMKQTVLPTLQRDGGMRDVTYATVDADSDRDVASQLMRGSAIPQLIVFAKTPDGKWHRDQITGETSAAQVKSLIARALAAQKAPIAKPEVTTTGAIGN
ncbi:MAG TPA: thioredoxin family protein [Pirellulaceae bacterium]|jgi:thioredoxin-like negative regulator of GroEL